MKGALLLFFVAFFSQSFAQKVNVTCASGKYPPHPASKVETYTINLDLPPEQRWTELVKAKATQIQNLINGFKEIVDGYGFLGELLVALIDSRGGSLDGTLPQPFAGEIEGMAKASGINLGEMVLYNLFYEFSTLCTSVVAQDANGKLYHARNLDFGGGFGWDNKTHEWIIAEGLRPLIVNLDWQRKGKTVFKSVSFAGYTGILTAVKPSMFTLTMNERTNDGGALKGIIEWFFGYRNESWMAFATRDVMETETSIQGAIWKIQNTVMLSPGYFILGGTKPREGYVVTRAPEKALDTWNMTQAYKWYILETNYDHWTAPPKSDDRRDPANYCMNQKMGSGTVGFDGIFNVLSTPPVLNKATTYTALMQVDSGILETYIQDCKDSC